MFHITFHIMLKWKLNLTFEFPSVKRLLKQSGCIVPVSLNICTCNHYWLRKLEKKKKLKMHAMQVSFLSYCHLTVLIVNRFHWNGFARLIRPLPYSNAVIITTKDHSATGESFPLSLFSFCRTSPQEVGLCFS